MNMETDYYVVHFLGHSEMEGGAIIMEQECTKTIRCFVCGKRVEPEEIVVMSFNEDDMVCVCKGHIKYAYPELSAGYTSPGAEGVA